MPRSTAAMEAMLASRLTTPHLQLAQRVGGREVEDVGQAGHEL